MLKIRIIISDVRTRCSNIFVLETICTGYNVERIRNSCFSYDKLL